MPARLFVVSACLPACVSLSLSPFLSNISNLLPQKRRTFPNPPPPHTHTRLPTTPPAFPQLTFQVLSLSNNAWKTKTKSNSFNSCTKPLLLRRKLWRRHHPLAPSTFLSSFFFFYQDQFEQKRCFFFQRTNKAMQKQPFGFMVMLQVAFVF
jgi:hypothetical protein